MGRHDVEEAVLRPMQRLYLPPKHLRVLNADDPEAREEALELYFEALERFDRDTLERAFRRVRSQHTYSIWPTPAVLEQAAEAVQPRPRPPTEVEQKRQRAWEVAAAYADAYLRRRQLAKIARQEGWLGRLRNYVQGVAWVQAQLIEGLAEDGICMPGELTKDYRSSAEALQTWRKACARPVAAGKVDVKVPDALVAAWRQASREHQTERPRAPG